MNKDECRTVDWRTVGYEDGVAGHSGERIGHHRKPCAEHGVTPDLVAYRAGRAEGLREFCQPHNGYRAGVNGAPYYDSCPSELAPAFVAAYESGRELYVRKRRSPMPTRPSRIAGAKSRASRADSPTARSPSSTTPRRRRSAHRRFSTPSTPPSASAASSPRLRRSSATAPATSRSSRPTARPWPRYPEPEQSGSAVTDSERSDSRRISNQDLRSGQADRAPREERLDASEALRRHRERE